jgi:glycosyltransferase involved in cell wall biosynthesis
VKDVVWVTLDFYPDDQASSQLFTDLLLRLSDEGVRITVLCGFPVAATNGRPGPMPRSETLGALTIKRCGFNVPEKHGLLNRALLYAAFLLHATLRLLAVPRTTTVFGVTSPPYIAQILWLTSRIKRFPYMYMFLDLYPEALLALGRLRRDSRLTRLWMSCNGLSYRNARRLAVLGRDMIPLLAAHYRLDSREIVYIPHWSAIEPPVPRPFAENLLARELGLEGKFVVQYSGNMGLLHDIDTLVRAAASVRDDDSIHFLFIGKGRRRAEARRLAEELGLSNITWLDFVPRERLPETLTCCHAALISLRQGMQGVAVPSKLYGILASGRAVIAQVPSESEVAMVVREEDCGVIAAVGSAQDLARQIRTLAGDRDRVRAMGERSLEAYRTKYTVAQAVAAFRELWGLSPST